MSVVSVATPDDNKLESVLQHIFAKCGVFILISSPCLTRHKTYVSDKVQISRIIEYIEDQLPTWPIDRLVELRKCLGAVSSNGYVNLQQFKEVTKYWISHLQQTLSLQDNNNNMQESFDTDNVMYANCDILNDADSSLKKTTVDVDRDVMEFELRMKIRELQEKNDLLHDELERHEAVIDNLKVQCNNMQKQLDRHVQKCQQLEKENDEQREELNKAILKEKTIISTVQRCAKEKENLTKRMETMEIELQSISALEERIEKLHREKTDAARQVLKLQEEFDEKENECKHLRSVVAELEDTNSSLKKSYEYTINNLRDQNRQLAEENTELQSLSIFNQYSRENLSMSPSISDGYRTHSTPYKCTTKVLLEESLYTELKASGFVAGCANDSCKLEDSEPCEHDDTISTVSEQLEKIIRICVAMWGLSSNDVADFDPRNTKTHSTEALRRRMSILLSMATEEHARRTTKDASTQLRADAADAAETLAQFGIPCFRDLSSAHTHRLVHTLPSCPRSPRAENAENTTRQNPSGCPSPKAESFSFVFARGDSLARENVDAGRSATEDPLVFDGNRACEMSKAASAPQPNLAVLKEENSKTYQMAEATSSGGSSSASNPSSPRRKISVYCRSYDVTTMRDSRQNDRGPGSSEASGSPSDETADDGSARIGSKETRGVAPFGRSFDYRCPKTVSDSSTDSTPTKSFGDSLADNEESPCKIQPPARTVRLAPMRLTLSRKLENDLNLRTTPLTTKCAFPTADSTESGVSLLSSTVDSGHEKDDGGEHASVRSSATFIVDKCEMKDSTKIADFSEDPHSRRAGVEQRVGSESRLRRVEQSVDSEMSSREDSSDSESGEPAATATESGPDLCAKRSAASGEAADMTADEASGDPASAKISAPPREKNAVQNDRQTHDRDAKRKAKGQRVFTARRSSFSEGENNGRSKCRCKQNVESTFLIPEESQSRIFPSLTDVRLQESGIAYLSDTELLNSRENLSELELQKKYTAFSLCLCTDRITLPQRVAISLRQRDQSENNLLREMQKMQHDIQDLAPLCTDRESVERVERVRHRLDMIARCAHRVSCTAETLGAVHQERRVARAVLLADRYLRMLQSRCEKLAVNIAETKRILTENNIVIEENTGELGDDLPRMRYRSGATCANNRMMMAKRRASVATMSRPMGNTQEVTKDTVRQRNSVCGRMTLRRPSFSSESPKWEAEKLNHNNSSSNSELRGICEQTESRRSSKEENNNMIRPSRSNSQSNCTIVEKEVWTSTKQEMCSEFLSANDDGNPETYGRPCARSLQFQLRNVSWRAVLWSIVIFFLGFFVNQTLSTMNNCCTLNSWSIEQILGRYIEIRNAAPHPM